MGKLEAKPVFPADSAVGWRDIAERVGACAKTLAQAHSDGRLPVKPIKLGTTVVMTPEMLLELRSKLDAKRRAAL